MSAADDGSINDEWSLLRRVHPTQIVPSEGGGEPRVSSAAFKDVSMSVDVEESLAAQGKDWKFSLQSHPSHSLVKLIAAIPRSLNQAVVAVPIVDNPAHAEVRGDKPGSVARALSKAAAWVHRR
ncbi:hypothetical protein [Reyranella sp.]|jgi:hypothetical protein|uniref:hypothetical protein n=1 Tax=Reyranella sp. TaxID=1929291 RepID=UPI0026028902|nr:hypothetical protein [Reyranella sp.]HQS18889.1 hypothetical protein [Reyranella sp.]HQT12802.1 hypothetical protein [Reyranella sp.]